MLNRLKAILRRLLGSDGRARIYSRVGRVEARLVELQIQLARRSAAETSAIGTRLDQLETTAHARFDRLESAVHARFDRLADLQAERSAALRGEFQIQHRALLAGLEAVLKGVEGEAAETRAQSAERAAGIDAAFGPILAALNGLGGALAEAAGRQRADMAALSGAVRELPAMIADNPAPPELIDAVTALHTAQAALDREIHAAGVTAHAHHQDLTDAVSLSSAAYREMLDAASQRLSTAIAEGAVPADTLEAVRSLAALPERVAEDFRGVEAAALARHADLANSLLSTRQFGLSMREIVDELQGKLGGGAGFDALRTAVSALDQALADQSERLRDREVMAVRDAGPATWLAGYALKTDHPIAFASDDHRFPRGTAHDNSRSPRFVAACERLWDRPIQHLDLGCAGGGLVRDFLIRGHRSMGLEGSDWSLQAQRAEWRVLGERLRTCDITQPFDLFDNGALARFDVISAWEVLEHLPEAALPAFFDNVRRHLGEHGRFVASIATFEDRDPATGAVWHVTIKPRPWWEARFEDAGLAVVQSPFAPRDYVRGSGASSDDWDAGTQPDMGFHLVASVSNPGLTAP